MNAFTQIPSLFVAALLSTVVVASPVPGDSTDGSPSNISAPHNYLGAAVVNPGLEFKPKTNVKIPLQSQKCITFTSDNPNWVYRTDGVWSGAGSGSFGQGQAKICVPHTDSAGGAMFIAAGPDTPPGSTKLECYFPTRGTANCDVSLVDGYSLSVTCRTARKSTPNIGGPLNLWKAGANCDNKSQLGQGICRNDKGYAPSQNDVTSFFKNAITNGNNYCVWVNCNQDYFFDVNEDLSCHVSGGR